MTTASSTRYFIAVPANDQGSGIYGIGLSEDAALQDVRNSSGWREPVVRQDDDGRWLVVTDTGEDAAFSDENEARRYADEKGFSPRPCTERLYRWVELHGSDAGHFSWSQPGYPGIDDLDIDQDDVDAAVHEVELGFEGCTAQDDWTAEDALDDAHEYVDVYLMQDENTDEDLRNSIKADPQLRFAVDLAVADIILADIAEREEA